jgi:molybdenum cofactor cytidylyltransferase
MIRHAAETALSSQCSKVTVVLGAGAGQIRGALSGLPVRIVENSRWTEGMGTSIQTGLAEHVDNDGLILALADQPLITAKVYDRLIGEHCRSGQPIVASQYAGTVGVPVFFAKEFFGHLAALKPGQGCKGVILEHSPNAVLIDCPEAEMDVDTPADYEQFCAARIDCPSRKNRNT